MSKKRVFAAFDYDDVEVKNELMRQGALQECPFQLEDCSLEKKMGSDWPKIAQARIQSADFVVVLCGEQSHQSGGSSTEVQFAQASGKKMFCLAATRKATPTPPPNVRKGTPIYTWTWTTIATLLDGRVPPDNAVVRYAP